MACSVIDEQEIVRRYVEDETISREQLANEYGTSNARIRRILEKHNVEVRTAKKVLSDTIHKEILKLYFEEKISVAKIASLFDINETTVRKQLIKDSRYSKRTNNNLSQSERESIIKEYLENEVTHTEIAERYGYTRSWASRLIKNTSIDDSRYSKKSKKVRERKNTPRRRLSVSAEELIEEIERTHITQRALADKYKVSESCIYHAIARYRGKKE